MILIAFSFGAFFEGAAGFGTPVAVTAAILIQLGFKPLQASGLSLIANTAPVAFGALGTPIIALAQVTGMDEFALSQMVGRQLPFFSVIVPFWVVWAFGGWRGMLGVWPAALTAGVAFAVPQFLVSNFHGPWLVDIVASSFRSCHRRAVAILATAHGAASNGPRLAGPPTLRSESQPPPPANMGAPGCRGCCSASVVFVWGLPSVKTALEAVSSPKFAVPGLDSVVVRDRRPSPAAGNAAEAAVYKLYWLTATGTGILVAGLSAVVHEVFAGDCCDLRATLWRVRFSLITIAAMLALGYVTKYSRHRRHAGPRPRAHRRALSIFRHAARLARRRARPARTPRRMFSSAACRGSPRNRPGSAPFSCARRTVPAV